MCTCLGLHRLHGSSEGMERSTFDVQVRYTIPRGDETGKCVGLHQHSWGSDVLVFWCFHGFINGFARFDSVLI